MNWFLLLVLFQSTLSVRRATGWLLMQKNDLLRFQSTLSVRRATVSSRFDSTGFKISIHALREESDIMGNTHKTLALKFQSTLSVRRATCVGDWASRSQEFQSTLSVRRATFFFILNPCKTNNISIHALREESDTRASLCDHHLSPISIHALREESDLAVYAIKHNNISYFNPRSP